MADDKAAPLVLDFSNVKERGDFNPKHMEEGDYLGKITGVTVTSPKDKPETVMWVFKVIVPAAGVTAAYPYRCTIAENQLWKIRNLFVACGFKVPKSKIKVDPNKVVGKEVGISLVDNEYEGKMNSQVNAIFPASDLPEQSASRGSASPDEADDVEVEEAAEVADDTPSEVTEDELNELDVEEL